MPWQVIDSYWLPEAVWVDGPWDSCQSCDDMETREVTCSRGSWLLCSGVVLSLLERHGEMTKRSLFFQLENVHSLLEVPFDCMNPGEVFLSQKFRVWL